MFLSEIPKEHNIVIAFTFGGKRYQFVTQVCDKEEDGEEAYGIIFAQPIEISGHVLKLDERCENFTVKYTNDSSGRTHVWKDCEIQYWEKGVYFIKSLNDSVPENRRGAVRIPIQLKTDCVVSMLEGRYPCVIHDVSVTGVGLNIEVELACKKIIHRLIYTHLDDPILKKSFRLKARCLYVTIVNGEAVRCGCEVLSVYPSINEYINQRQTRKMVRIINKQLYSAEETDLKED